MIRKLADAFFGKAGANSSHGLDLQGISADGPQRQSIGFGCKRSAFAGLALLALGTTARAGEDNDYPTDARVDYVFACMAANGQTRESLQKCSCSLDQLAAILPYDKYVQASTVLSMRQGIGSRANEFKSTKIFDDKVADLRRAQAEAEIRCYRG